MPKSKVQAVPVKEITVKRLNAEKFIQGEIR